MWSWVRPTFCSDTINEPSFMEYGLMPEISVAVRHLCRNRNNVVPVDSTVEVFFAASLVQATGLRLRKRLHQGRGLDIGMSNGHRRRCWRCYTYIYIRTFFCMSY